METTRESARNQRLRQARIERNWRQRELAEQLGTTVQTVKRWERGSQQPSMYFRTKLLTLFGKSVEELGLDEKDPSSPQTEENVPETEQIGTFSTEAEGIWMVPYARNPHFTGRDDLLEHLVQKLSLEPPGNATAPRRAILSQPQAITGLGGIGKTQIAVEYAYRAQEQNRYTHTFWISAASSETMLTSFQMLAEHLPRFAEKDEHDQHKLIAAVLRWLEQCPQPWLLIVDNADDLALVRSFLPAQGRGSLLLTTRATAVSWLARPLEVNQMGLSEGTQFLLHRTRRFSASDEERNEASNIVMALDGFPVALDQAGAYIEETGCSFGDYLHLYQQYRPRLLARRGQQATHYPDSVATTWLLSFQQVEQAHPAAALLLQLCASLSPDHIPEELLIVGAAYWPAPLQQAVTNPFRFNELLEALLAFSLVKRLAQERMLSLHRLVQAIQLDQMEVQVQREWAQRVVRAVHTLFPADPKGEAEAWPQCQRYLEQAQACNTLIQQHRLQMPEAAELLERAGIYLGEHASFSLAEQLLQRALTIAEQHFGPQHLQVASLLASLGELSLQQSQYEQAEPFLRRALQIREMTLGPHHLQIALTLNLLGILSRHQGKYEQAEHFWQRALQIREQTLGLHHPQVASPLNNLGILYCQQGKYEQAEPVLQRALQIREQALGSHHHLLAYPLHNLGELYLCQGNYEQAESVLQRALQIREQALGSHHHLLAYPLDSLGELFLHQGKYEQAEPFLQRALHICEQAVGPHHPQTAMTLNNLGVLSYGQGKYEQAELLLQRALQIREQALGAHHLQVAESLHALANLARDQGHYEQAEARYQRALSIQQQDLGPEHLDLAETLHDLALLRERQQRPAEALSLFEQALAMCRALLGPDHPKTRSIQARALHLPQEWQQGKTE